MKKCVYYLRDHNNVPSVAVAIHDLGDKKFVRVIAIRSDRDGHSKKRVHQILLDRFEKRDTISKRKWANFPEDVQKDVYLALKNEEKDKLGLNLSIIAPKICLKAIPTKFEKILLAPPPKRA